MTDPKTGMIEGTIEWWAARAGEQNEIDAAFPTSPHRWMWPEDVPFLTVLRDSRQGGDAQ